MEHIKSGKGCGKGILNSTELGLPSPKIILLVGGMIQWISKSSQFNLENSRALACVRTAVFVLCLDDAEEDDDDGTHGEKEVNGANGGDTTEQRLKMMESDGLEILNGHGPKRNGLNRWFDATIQVGTFSL